LGGQFSFVSDFLISPNQANSATNVWQYFHGVDTGNRTGVFQRLPVFAIGIQNSGTDGWRAGADGPPYVGVHMRSDNIFPYVAIGEGHVHPGSEGLGVAIGFRAPSNGVYQVSGSVRAAGGGSINWYLYRGDSSNLLAGGRHLQAKLKQNFDTPPITLSVGEFVFLAVDNDGDWYADSAAVEIVVKAWKRAQLGVQPVTYADITVLGEAGHSYRVEYLDALAGANQWLLLTNLTLVGTSQTFRDQNPSLGQRFYRVVEVP
jgi:hypothetical protein